MAIKDFVPVFYTPSHCPVVKPRFEWDEVVWGLETIANDHELPEGFTYLGKGWSRTAYLGPDGLVYKVPTSDYSAGLCVSERDRYTRLCEDAKKVGVHLAKAYWHEDARVLTMEFCSKSRDLVWTETEKIGRLGIGDLHDGNAWLDDKGRIVVVDYAQ